MKIKNNKKALQDHYLMSSGPSILEATKAIKEKANTTLRRMTKGDDYINSLVPKQLIVACAPDHEELIRSALHELDHHLKPVADGVDQERARKDRKALIKQFRSWTDDATYIYTNPRLYSSSIKQIDAWFADQGCGYIERPHNIISLYLENRESFDKIQDMQLSESELEILYSGKDIGYLLEKKFIELWNEVIQSQQPVLTLTLGEILSLHGSTQFIDQSTRVKKRVTELRPDVQEVYTTVQPICESGVAEAISKHRDNPKALMLTGEGEFIKRTEQAGDCEMTIMKSGFTRVRNSEALIIIHKIQTMLAFSIAATTMSKPKGTWCEISDFGNGLLAMKKKSFTFGTRRSPKITVSRKPKLYRERPDEDMPKTLCSTSPSDFGQELAA